MALSASAELNGIPGIRKINALFPGSTEWSTLTTKDLTRSPSPMGLVISLSHIRPFRTSLQASSAHGKRRSIFQELISASIAAPGHWVSAGMRPEQTTRSGLFNSEEDSAAASPFADFRRGRPLAGTLTNCYPNIEGNSESVHPSKRSINIWLLWTPVSAGGLRPADQALSCIKTDIVVCLWLYPRNRLTGVCCRFRIVPFA